MSKPGWAANFHGKFEAFAHRVAIYAGRPSAFLSALAVVILWLLSGPLFAFSDTWQLVINTGTTIVTFLMVFLIQQAQNKDSHSIQLKLNELLAASPRASDRLINVEELSDEELERLHRFYDELVALARKDRTLNKSHSIEEAQSRHDVKKH